MTNFRNEFARRWRSFALLSVMLLAVPVLAIACPSSDDTAVTPDPEPPVVTPDPVVMPDPDPAPSDEPITFTIAIPDNLTGSNIWGWIGTDSTAYNFAAFLNRYPSLMKYSDRRYDWIPNIADGFPGDVMPDGDGFSVTAKIRPGLTWNDGSPLNAHDLAFVADTVLGLELSGNWAAQFNADFFDRAEVVDDLTIKYYFTQEPGLAIWQFGTALATIVPDEYWRPLVENLIAEYDDPATEVVEQAVRDQLFSIDASDEPTVGPVTILAREQDAFVSLERNDGYYLAGSVVKQYSDGTHEETVDGQTGTYYGDAGGTVELEFTRDQQQNTTIFSEFQTQDAAILALRAGEVDYFLSPLGLSTGLRSQVEGAEGVSIFQNPSNGFRYLGFNTRREPFSDVAFRQAVATLIDLELIANSVLQGAVLPIYSVVPEGNGFWYNPDTPRYGFNMVDGELVAMTREERIAETIEILTTAGYTWESEPSWDADNRRVVEGVGLSGPDGALIEEFEILSPGHGYDSFRATTALLIEQWLNQAGIPAEANLTGFNEIVQAVFTDQDFDMWILGWGLTPYPDHMITFFTAGPNDVNIVTDGFNAGGWVNQEYEDLAADFLAETDVNEARRLAFEMQDVLARELPYVTLFATPIIEAYRSDVFEFAFTDVLDGVQNLFQSSDGPLSNTVFE